MRPLPPAAAPLPGGRRLPWPWPCRPCPPGRAAPLPLGGSPAKGCWSCVPPRHASLQAFFRGGASRTGPRCWIDLPGAPQRTRSLGGNGVVRQVRVGRPNDATTRLVVEFSPGTRLDPRQPASGGHQRGSLAHGVRRRPSAACQPIGEGDLDCGPAPAGSGRAPALAAHRLHARAVPTGSQSAALSIGQAATGW
jgi:N-acetylmuramoyl-L-alanine amidase